MSSLLSRFSIAGGASAESRMRAKSLTRGEQMLKYTCNV